MMVVRSNVAALRPRYTELVTLLWYTGARISELSALRVGDMQLASATPSVTIRAESTKTRTERTIPITRGAARRLYDRYAGHPATAHIFPSPTKPHGYNDPVTVETTTRTLSTWIRRAANAAGIPTLTPHSFRHNYATRILRSSNLRVAQILLGHKAITSTQLYTHPTADDLQRAVAAAFAED